MRNRELGEGVLGIGTATTRRALLQGLAMAALASAAGCTTRETLAVNTRAVAPLPEKYAEIVVDASTGATLHEVSSSKPRYPASLTKMMTLYLLFEALDNGRVTPATVIPVSAFAAGQAPSKLGLKAGQTIDVDTAIRAIAVKSANDVACAVGEYLSGSEPAFAAAMTAKARALGMASTTFRNASGLHDPAQVTTARDMALLGIRLRHDFPNHFDYFALRSFTYNGRFVRGHNRTLDTIPGASGIKTGYTKASGFNLVTSVERTGRLVIAVVMGEDTAQIRDQRMAGLVAQYMGAAR